MGQLTDDRLTSGQPSQPSPSKEDNEYPPVRTPSAELAQVPEITIYFWVIKGLCTTLGESAGVPLEASRLLFGVLLAATFIGWSRSEGMGAAVDQPGRRP